MDPNKNTISDVFSTVLHHEVELLRPQAHDPEQSAEACADKAELVGLAFSGGGIRSATFCLGVIQALSRLSLLRTFDYLSTVSGGGYIGGWLSALIHRTHQPGQPMEATLAEVERGLAGQEQPWCTPGTPASECPPEHPSLRFLRRFSNYLTPRLGLLSGDSLAAISTYLRNLLLNQLILAAFFGALLTLPYFMLSLARCLGNKDGFAMTTRMWLTDLPLIYGLAALPMIIAVGMCASSLMQYLKHDRLSLIGQGVIISFIVFPSLLSAFVLAVAVQADTAAGDYAWWQWVLWTMVAYALPWMAIGWVKIEGGNLTNTALKKALAVYAASRNNQSPLAALHDFMKWAAGVAHFLWQIPWTLLSGALGGVLFYSLAQGAHKLPPLGGIDYATAFGTPLVLLSFSVAVTLHVGLMKRLYSENDREWWARLGGFILLAALVWTAVFAVTLYAAPLVKWLAGLAVAGGLAWIITSVGGVLLGKSTLTGGNTHAGKGQAAWGKVVLVAPYVFIIGLLIALSSVLNTALTSETLCEKCEPLVASQYFTPILDTSLANLNEVSLAAMAWVGGVCALVFGLLGWRVDINLFSLHGFYRNRLTRCYLGGTRLGKTLPAQVRREPHPFTGFDPKDDLPLSRLAEQRPYAIINAAMNLCGGEDLAWQTRRAASFAFTPCHTGFEFWNSRGIRKGAYRCTQEYSAKQFRYLNAPGGVLLGNVMATSGAAANPNMGYHTSAALSALMSVFNVRLGRWCGNTRHPDAWRMASPHFGGLSLVKEVFGMLDSQSPFLNISDGGHFENLGIYELVRRRCHVVVAVDAGCDPEYQYEDLANAIRKCWTDFGTRIQIDLASMRRKSKARTLHSHFALGCIHYPNGGEPGILIYIKASLSGDEPSDVKEYADRHSSFPHESTGDQFFDENQFESYRELGRHIGLKVFAPMFPPKEYINENEPEGERELPAKEMTPQQLRDALLGSLLRHPALQPNWQGKRGQPSAPAHEDAQDRKNWFNAVVSAVSSRIGKPAEPPGE